MESAQQQRTVYPSPPAKIILWSTPRSLSTVIEKCLSYVPNSVIWHEPFVSAMWFGKDRRFLPIAEAVGKVNSHVSEDKDQEALGKMDSNVSQDHDVNDVAEEVSLPEGVGYDETLSSYSWCKEQLEADYPDKRLVFAKDISSAVCTRFEHIPDGYTHSFLIRHPMKMLPSWKKLVSAVVGRDVKMTDMPESALPRGCFFKESYDLLRHVREHLDSNPVIIDADDLLSNPRGMLKAYCEAVGIPYNGDLLHWESGDDITHTWMTPRRLLRAHNIIGCYKDAFNSTQFNRPGRMPSRNDLTEDELHCVDKIMPYYEEMYDQRLIC